jgi:hypothetical protein
MATQNDVRRIALSLPEVEEAADRFAFSVRNKGKLKGCAWVWLERVEPRKARVPQPDVLVRLNAVSVADLEVLITEAWCCQAPKALVARLRRNE